MANPKKGTPAHAEWRRKKNAKRKLARRLCAAGRALPPVVGLSKGEFYRLTQGTPEQYDAYAETFIAAAKKARRRYEFPLEPLGGVQAPALREKRTARKPVSK